VSAVLTGLRSADRGSYKANSPSVFCNISEKSAMEGKREVLHHPSQPGVSNSLSAPRSLLRIGGHEGVSAETRSRGLSR
jgi:hypothetical protein